jgi:hypothetical protein
MSGLDKNNFQKNEVLKRAYGRKQIPSCYPAAI